METSDNFTRYELDLCFQALQDFAKAQEEDMNK